MKLIILLFFAFAFMGYPGELVFRVMIDKSKTLKEKLHSKEIKLLLMFPVYGGACVLIALLYQIPFMQNIKMLPLLCLFGMIIADIFEFGYGMLFNRLLKLGIWDYSKEVIKIGKITIPLNIMGQVDILHSTIWFCLTPLVIYFDQIIRWLAS
jgi:uncharacterized membrane protein